MALTIIRKALAGWREDKRSGLALREAPKLIAGGGIDNPFAASPRNLYVHNGVDVFGFDASLVSQSGATGTSPAYLLPDNLRAQGYIEASITTAGSIGYQAANPVAGRPNVMQLQTAGNTNDGYVLYGLSGGVSNLRTERLELPTPMKGSFTKRVMEAFIVPGTLSLVDFWVGWCNTNADPFGNSFAGAMFQASNDAANWKAVAIKAGVAVRTAAITAASTTAVQRVKIEISAGGTMVVTVNGVASTVVAQANMPNILVRQQIGIMTRTAANKVLNVEWLYDRWE